MMKIFIILSISMLLLVFPNISSSRMLYNCPPPAPAQQQQGQQPINFFIDNSRSGDEDNTNKIILIVVSLIGTVVAGGAIWILACVQTQLCADCLGPGPWGRVRLELKDAWGQVVPTDLHLLDKRNMCRNKQSAERECQMGATKAPS
ncbi:hypothetical protein Tco_0121550 [Tanacetum coccineum]